MGRRKCESEEEDSYGSIIAGSDEEGLPLSEDDDGSFVVPTTPSSSSSSSYVSDSAEDFAVSSDEAEDDDAMESEASHANIDAATVIDVFGASNPAQHISKNVPREMQAQLLDLLSEWSEKISSFPDRAPYVSIKCVAVERLPDCLRVYKNARNKPTTVQLDESHSSQRVMAFLILNNFKQIIKTWRKSFGDETLYRQLQKALAVI